MSGEFYGFEMHYHTISAYGYDTNDPKDRKFHKLEKQGYIGLTVSDFSQWELREIRKWVKRQTAHIYVSKVEGYHTTDNGGYDDACICMWFSEESQSHNFTVFLESLPKREYSVDFERGKFSMHAHTAYLKDEMKANRRLVERDKVITITFDDEIEAMEFKLRWL